MNGASKPPTEPFLYALKNAYAAMHRGDKRAAHRYAEKAISIDPRREEPWLVLAALASPHGSIFYLKQALKINPESEPARKGLKWALKRMPPAIISAPARVLPKVQIKPRHKPFNYLLALSILLVVCAGLWAQSYGRQPIQKLAQSLRSPIRPTTSASLPVLTAQVPGLAPTTKPAAGHPRVATATPAPPAVQPAEAPPESPVEAQVSAPEAAPLEQPVPTTYIVRRGDTLSEIAARFDISIQDLIAANHIANPSAIRPGQEYIIPGASQEAQTEAQPATTAKSSPAVEQPEAPAEVSAASVEAQQTHGSKYLLVDISDQLVYAYEGDTLVYTFSVSTGRGGATPVGSFRILTKEGTAWSAPWGFWMPDWMGFTSGSIQDGFHSLPVLTNGETLWGDQIGTPVSYGCVVLRPEDSAQLYAWAEIGIPLEIQH